MITNNHRQDRFFYLTLEIMMDSYIISQGCAGSIGLDLSNYLDLSECLDPLLICIELFKIIWKLFVYLGCLFIFIHT